MAKYKDYFVAEHLKIKFCKYKLIILNVFSYWCKKLRMSFTRLTRKNSLMIIYFTIIHYYYYHVVLQMEYM